MGETKGAVLHVLEHGGQMSPRNAHLAVERRLGRFVSYDTVASFLSVAARDGRSPIRRIGPGSYAADG